MPGRVWVWIAVIVAAAAVGVVALILAVPDPLGRRAAEEASRSAAVADAAAAEAPPAANEAVPPELVADLAALAAARLATVPTPHRPVLGGPPTLTFVSATGPQLTLIYEIEIDVQDYPLPADPTELFPALEARYCPGAAPRVCYVFTDRFAATVCSDPAMRPLLERGAIVHYLFRDLNQRPLTDVSVAIAHCAV